MRIAQISPLYESVPPSLYGGTERVVHYITEELISGGHEVTLFASGDSICSGKLISPTSKATRLDKNCADQMVSHFTMMEMVEKESKNFDIIHSHIDYLHFPLIRRSKAVYVTTIHGRLDLPELQPLYSEYNDIPLISISDSQRKPVPQANWLGTVYHGLPPNLYKFNSNGGNYLSFVGRVSPEKRIDRAIEIAIKSGIPIKIAAKVDNADMEYYEAKIKNLLKHPLVEFLGEVGDSEKGELLGNSLGMIYPIDWPEPFGLAMIESMACGTPVIAYNNGSVSEVIDEGETGFIVNSIGKAIKCVENLTTIDRNNCRRTFEKRFSASRMVADYLSIYKQLVKNHKKEHLAQFPKSTISA
jgi:glycosyltransferase involved in cell wall biosynthesis